MGASECLTETTTKTLESARRSHHNLSKSKASLNEKSPKKALIKVQDDQNLAKTQSKFKIHHARKHLSKDKNDKMKDFN